MTPQSTEIVQQLELELLQPATRGDRTAIERLLAKDFVEIGSTGERSERDAVITGLLAEHATTSSPVRHVEDLRVTIVTDDVLLVTYRVRRTEAAGTVTRRYRSSIWRRQAERWQMVFHQGTPSIAQPQLA